MYLAVTRALQEERTDRIKSRTKSRDAEVNRLQSRVQRAVYQHLSMQTRQDVLSALQLFDVASELERVGDYSKNIAELADMIPGAVDWGPQTREMAQTRDHVLEMFDLTFRIVEQQDRHAAQRCEDLYGQVARYCDSTVEQVVTPGDIHAETVPRHQLALVLMLRYTKRVAAHLRNAARTMTNPYHRIGAQ